MRRDASSAKTALSPGAAVLQCCGDWAELMKLRLASLVTLGALVGAILGAGAWSEFPRALEAAFWISCSAASGGALNQVLERESDRRMKRTAGRPLLTGRISVRNAILVAGVLGASASFGLALRFNLLSAFMALGSLFCYVAIYTPLKRVSSLNTLVGALPGAMPVAIGYAALAGGINGWAVSLFAIVFAWQFPHFMAIAWIYREDYRRAGMIMVPVLEGGERAAGIQAFAYSLVLLPISLLPSVWGDAGAAYGVGALAAGLMYSAYSLRFTLVQNQCRARALFVVSLIYLPVLFAVIFIDQWISGGLGA